jgi:hypothetical protein
MKPINQAKISYYNLNGWRISVSRNREGFWHYSLWRKKPEFCSEKSECTFSSSEIAFQKARKRVTELIVEADKE